MFFDKIRGFTPYIPFSYKDGLIRMDCNESPFKLSEEISDSLKKELNKIDFNRYPDPYAKDLVTAFCSFYNVDFDNVVAGNGSDELLSLLLSILPDKGTKIVTLDPDFSMYSFYSVLGENKSLVFKQDSYSLDIDAFCAFVNGNNADVAIFSNPRNPTGYGLDRESVLDICKRCSDTLIVVDEAYMDFSDQSVLDSIKDYDNLIVLKTLSKCFGLAAQRIGFAVGNKRFIDSIKIIKSPYNLNSLSQLIGRIILENKKAVFENRDKIILFRDDLYNRLKKLENDSFVVYPTSANFVYIKTDKAAEIFNYLLENNIVVRKFESALRITASYIDDNALLEKLLKDGIGK